MRSTVGPQMREYITGAAMELEPIRPEPNLWTSHPVYRLETWPATADTRRQCSWSGKTQKAHSLFPTPDAGIA